MTFEQWSNYFARLKSRLTNNRVAGEEIAEEEEDENVCRVCRSGEGELYSPCLCSGSIQFVHQECLVQWLKYRNKEKCEVCDYNYSFKKSYRVDEISVLRLFGIIAGAIRRIFQSVCEAFMFGILFFAWILLPLLATFGFYSLCLLLCGDFSEISYTLFEKRAFADPWASFSVCLCLRTYPLLRELYVQIITRKPQDFISLVPVDVESDPEQLRRILRAQPDLFCELLFIIYNRPLDEEEIQRQLGLNFFTVIRDPLAIVLYYAATMSFFVFGPYIIGGMVLRAVGVPANIHDAQTFLEVAVGYSAMICFCWILHFFARCLKLSGLYRVLGIGIITLQVTLFAFLVIGCIPLACGYWVMFCSRSLLGDFNVKPSLTLHWILGLLYMPFLAWRIVLPDLFRHGRWPERPNLEEIAKQVIELPAWHLARLLVDITTYLFATVFVTTFLPFRLLAVTTTVLPYNMIPDVFNHLTTSFKFFYPMVFELVDIFEQFKDLPGKSIQLWIKTIFKMVGLERCLSSYENEQPAQFAYFPLRVICLCGLVAISWMIAGTLLFSVPVSAGRLALFLLTGDSSVHDLHTVFVGAYVCMLIARAGISFAYFIPPLIVHLREKSLRKGFLLVVRLAAIVIPIAVVLPLLFVTYIKLLFIIPLTVKINQSAIHNPLEDWVLGLSFMRCVYIIANIDGHPKQAIEQIYADGLAGLRVNFIYRKLLIPAIMAVATAIALPYVIARIFISRYGLSRVNALLAVRNSYLLVILSCIPILGLYYLISNVFKWIKEDIRKEKIGIQLINHEKHTNREEARMLLNRPHNE